jgi:inositol transport system ATP-binding protein
MEYLLEMKSISKSFSGTYALQNVSLRLRPGSVLALMGENGAGKSTLMKILSGIYRPDEGEILIKGERVTINSPRDSLNLGISMIHQELTPIDEMTIAENIFLGREPTRMGVVWYAEMYRRTRELFDQIGIPLDPKTRMKDLKVSDIQLVEIAKAVSYDSDIIIMDEPTSAITDREVHQLFRVIRDLKSKGKGIIYISHKMDEIFEISDDIMVLRDGQFIDSKPAGETNNKELITMMVGRELKDIFPGNRPEPGEVVLEVKGLTKHKWFHNVSFELRKGEILGFAGLMGSGRTEVMEALFGIVPFDSGEILLEGKPIRFRKPAEAIGSGLAFVTEDRKVQGLNLLASIKHNITISSLPKVSSRIGVLQNRQENKVAEEYIQMLRIKSQSRDQWVKFLSGGNQQKVVIAKWLMTNPRILIMDEPTRGIDIGAKTEIYKLMNELVHQGYSIIMISSELPEVIGMSHRVVVFHNRTVAGVLERDEATQEKIMELATGQHLVRSE